MTLRSTTALALIVVCGQAFAAPPECKQQKIEQSLAEICLVRGAAFQHDVYMLKLDNALVFALADDFSEKVSMEHVVPDGSSLEFSLSRQNGKTVKITGGCVPESKDGAEVARVCNFSWGRFQVVKDVRFEFN